MASGQVCAVLTSIPRSLSSLSPGMCHLHFFFYKKEGAQRYGFLKVPWIPHRGKHHLNSVLCSLDSRKGYPDYDHTPGERMAYQLILE